MRKPHLAYSLQALYSLVYRLFSVILRWSRCDDHRLKKWFRSQNDRCRGCKECSRSPLWSDNHRRSPSFNSRLFYWTNAKLQQNQLRLRIV